MINYSMQDNAMTQVNSILKRLLLMFSGFPLQMFFFSKQIAAN